MKTRCYSLNGTCPCLACNRNCCEESTDEHEITDTEKLCGPAREHCERCAKEVGGIDET